MFRSEHAMVDGDIENSAISSLLFGSFTQVLVRSYNITGAENWKHIWSSDLQASHHRMLSTCRPIDHREGPAQAISCLVYHLSSQGETSSTAFLVNSCATATISIWCSMYDGYQSIPLPPPWRRVRIVPNKSNKSLIHFVNDLTNEISDNHPFSRYISDQLELEDKSESNEGSDQSVLSKNRKPQVGFQKYSEFRCTWRERDLLDDKGVFGLTIRYQHQDQLVSCSAGVLLRPNYSTWFVRGFQNKTEWT
jgi:hypothetical protein